MRVELSGLYAITPDWPDTDRLLSASSAILSAGCRLLQYRAKTADAALRRTQADALRALTTRFGARLIINDSVDLALACRADGVHLGEDDGELREAHLRLGPTKLVGASCYQGLDLAAAAAAAGADYLAFGAFFASPTKPLARRADLALLAEAKRQTDLPICAIGGICVDNAAVLLAAGADLLAVITALYDAPDPAQATLNFMQLIEENRP